MKLSEIQISKNCPMLRVSSWDIAAICSNLLIPTVPTILPLLGLISSVAVSAPVLMPLNTLLKFTSPCSNVGKDTSARSATLPLLWALRSSLAILAGLNRFGPWKGNTGSSMFKFRTFDKDVSQVYWHIDQAWPGESRNTENTHPFKSPTGWAKQLSKTESEH